MIDPYTQVRIWIQADDYGQSKRTNENSDPPEVRQQQLEIHQMRPSQTDDRHEEHYYSSNAYSAPTVKVMIRQEYVVINIMKLEKPRFN